MQRPKEQKRTKCNETICVYAAQDEQSTEHVSNSWSLLASFYKQNICKRENSNIYVKAVFTVSGLWNMQVQLIVKPLV